MKIGVVDLDTSHPQNWIPIERELGHEVVGIWDGGAVHPREYVANFAQERNIAVFDSLDALADAVDCAIIHGCDWDTHVQKAKPFVEAGKAVLLDKPIAGKVRDLRQLTAWSDKGARIAGGSSLRFCVETRDWLAQPQDQRGTPHTVLCGCAVDEFNYGIHAYSMLSGILGAGIKTVQHLGRGVQRRICVTWSNGAVGILVVGESANWLPFYAAVVTEKSVTQYQADSGKLYRALLEATLPYLEGKAPAPMSFHDLIEPELCALAARRSWLEGDREVALTELSESDEGYDGAVFAAGYRKARYPK